MHEDTGAGEVHASAKWQGWNLNLRLSGSKAWTFPQPPLLRLAHNHIQVIGFHSRVRQRKVPGPEPQAVLLTMSVIFGNLLAISVCQYPYL